MRHPSRLDLTEGLNDDLARAYARLIQGRTFASAVRGTDRLVLRPLFARHITYGISHAATVADAVVALRGTPAVRVAPSTPLTSRTTCCGLYTKPCSRPPRPTWNHDERRTA